MNETYWTHEMQLANGTPVHVYKVGKSWSRLETFDGRVVELRDGQVVSDSSSKRGVLRRLLNWLFPTPVREFRVCDTRTDPFTVLGEFEAPIGQETAEEFARRNWPEVPESNLRVEYLSMDA